MISKENKCNTLLYAICIMYIGFLLGCYEKVPIGVEKIHIKDTTLYVEIADEPHERIKGLQHRKRLLENWGMLFVYDAPKHLSFWMKDTQIPLDLAYIDANGRIAEIYELQPFDENVVQSKTKVKYVLEVNRCWFTDHNIRINDIVSDIVAITSRKE